MRNCTGIKWQCERGEPSSNCNLGTDRVIYGGGMVGVLGASVAATSVGSMPLFDLRATDFHVNLNANRNGNVEADVDVGGHGGVGMEMGVEVEQKLSGVWKTAVSSYPSYLIYNPHKTAVAVLPWPATLTETRKKKETAAGSETGTDAAALVNVFDTVFGEFVATGCAISECSVTVPADAAMVLIQTPPNAKVVYMPPPSYPLLLRM